MSAANSSDTSRGVQDTKSPHEQDKMTSDRLPQVVIFLRKTEAVIEQYLNKKHSSDDDEELQSTVKNLAIVLKSGDEDQSEYLLELMKEGDDKMMKLLSELVFQLFKSSVMQGDSLSPQHPLILAYYCVSLAGLTEKCVECGVIQLAVQHLKKLEMFITLTGELLTLEKLLMSFLFGCCDSQAAVAVMIQNQLHHSLTYYIQMFEFNAAILAKKVLAAISDNIDKHFLQLVKLNEKEISNIQSILMLAIETKSLYVRLMDSRHTSTDYHVKGFLKSLRCLTVNTDNLRALGSSVFISIYHSMLLEPALHGALRNILLLVKSVCSHTGVVASIHKDHTELLATLEQLTVGEELQDIVIEVIWGIMNGSDSTKMEANSIIYDGRQEEEKIADMLKTLMSGSAQFFLRNKMAKQIIEMNFHELKVQFSEILSILRYLMALNEHLDVSTITEKCRDKFHHLLQLLCDYSVWMICREEHLKESTWSLMHPLVLFHVVFYFIANTSDDGRIQLRDSGVLDVLVKELQILQLIPAWHKGLHYIVQLILLTLLKCSRVMMQGSLPSGLVEQFCVHEDFLYRISSKSLLAAFSTNNKLNLSLTEVLESEASSLLKLLCNSLKTPKKVFSITSALNTSLVFHVRFSDVIFMITALLQCNQANQKIFHDCFIKMRVEDSLQLVHPSLLTEVATIVTMIKGDVISLPDQLTSVSIHNNTTETEDHNQVLYWMCRVIDSIRAVVSPDPVDENLAEVYVPLEEESFLTVGMVDLLFNDLSQLSIYSSTQLGTVALHKLVSQMTHFVTLLKSLITLSFERIRQNNDLIKVTASTFLRLEKIFVIFGDHCQKSSAFCMVLAHSGIINQLMDGLFILYALQVHHTMDIEWMLLRLAEPIMYVLSVCTTNEDLHGYFKIAQMMSSWYCRVNFGRCVALAKIILSVLFTHLPGEVEDFSLTNSETSFLFELVSSAIYGQESEHAMWVAYSTDSRNSVKHLLSFCEHLIANPSNAEKLIKAGILDCISYLLQNYNEVEVLEVTLKLTAKLCMYPRVSIEVKENHANIITSLQQLLLQNEYLKVDTFYCLLCAGIEVPNITGMTDGHADATAMLKIGKLNECIQKLQLMLKDCEDTSTQIKLTQTLGEAYYKMYMTPTSTDGNAPKRYESARQAIKCLGTAYDHHLFSDEHINSKHLDLAMLDCIFNCRDKPLSRCLLCRVRCSKGEKLIRSHVWPESLLKHMNNFLHPSSQQVFDVTWKGIGKLQGPGQIYFTMLCKSCENLFSRYENAFKSLFVDKLYCNKGEDNRQFHVTDDEVVISLLKAAGAPGDWLYQFCLSIVFRMFTLASKGDLSKYGNIKDWYQCFVTWRNVLLDKNNAGCKPAPKVALFISPVNVLQDLCLPPHIAKVLFSSGLGSFFTYRLHDGACVSDQKPEMLLGSIGIINILVSYDDECFKFIPSECMVSPGSARFVIPSAIRRYLLFPKGLWAEYEGVATSIATRIYNMPRDKVTLSANKSWAEREVELFSGVLGKPLHKEELVVLGFLPPPFDRIGNKVQNLIDTLISSQSLQVILHHWKIKNSDHFGVFVLRNKGQRNFPKFSSIFALQTNGYIVWIAYKLSEDDLAVEDAIQVGSGKAFLPQVELEFQVKERLQKRITKIVSSAGFASKEMLISWLQEFDCGVSLDTRCFPSCLYCLELCNCCMGSTASSSAVPIYESIQGNIIQLATACDLDCTRYLTSTDPMPVILSQPKQSNATLQLRACTNGASIGLIKSKFIIHYFSTANDKQLSIWCQFRSAYQQEISKLIVDDNFELINEFSSNFVKIFADSKDEDKFTKFLKDVWYYFQSLLANPPVERQSVSTQESGKVDDAFEYYATMSVDPADVPPVLPITD